MKRPIYTALAGAAALALTLTGCSGGGDTSGGGTDGSSTADIAGAQAFLDEALKAPEGIGYDSPVTAAIPAGANVAVLETPVPVAQVTNGYRETAIKELGWNMTKIVVGNGPEDAAKAFDQALDTDPDAVFFAGYDPATLTTQLDRAEAAGVTVIAESLPYVAPDAEWPQIQGITRNLDVVDRSAKMTAAYLTVDSGGAADVEIFSVPSQVIILAYVEGIQKYLAEWCPDCKVNINDFEFTDIGSNLPGQVVSAIQRNPNAGYAIFGLGDATTGVVSALEGAGLSEQVKIGGDIPAPENYEALKAGTQDFWTADTTPVIAYKETDMMVRQLLGEDIDLLNSAPDIQQMLTPDNVGDAVFDDDGYWIGYADYADAYKKQWNLG